MRVGIIGVGNIGAALYERAQRQGWEVSFVLKSSGVYRPRTRRVDELKNYPRYAEGVDLVFVALPSSPDGKIAYDYLRFFLKRGTPVVTCEKGALGNFWPELEAWRGKLGYMATVGGGTRLLGFLSTYLNAETTQVVYAVVNGTLNYVMDELSVGHSLSEAVAQAQVLGYTEPGATDAPDLFQKEIQDVQLKAVIVFNHANLAPKRLRVGDLKVAPLTPGQFNEVVREAARWRYVLSIIRRQTQMLLPETVGGFQYQTDGWVMSGGFHRLDGVPRLRELVPRGGYNAVLVDNGQDGSYRLSGPGTGAGPTTAAMLQDALRLAGGRR